ncbi:DUF637 domain-containing protein [Acinetobacter radioresistens]|uniref:two-partner secretion domain-containing protein n=1 Tax=Acinetobacter radioresistens TaxID=40216 RepID=UPI002002F291|nr:DUF637 domain-containing protein [Acinetobacter radioresistens]
MNKTRYRIIFNKARQVFMAVAENAKSQTKTSGQSQGHVSASESTQPFHQLWQVKCLVTSISLWMTLAPAYAQIQADPTASAANRPVVGVGQNAQGQNVPVVNIQTPKNGVSHNIYKQMDVLAEGAVLNNSRTGASSNLVGTVGANPFLAKGEARIILNEVNSSIASRLEGNLEIAGQRADLIIANPAGINIKGGGFINASKAILTTGKPQLNADGSIQQFVIDQGKVTVTANTGSTLGLGGNSNNADYIDIYARALELNAQLHANQDINVITGTNTISASLENIGSKTSTVAAPTLAVDIKSLGGMYANNIYLMGTEKGLGVNNAGTLKAVNNLVVTNAGRIEHSGSISSSSTVQGLVNIATTGTDDTADINSSGIISSNSMLAISSAHNLNLNAKEIVINTGGVASSSLLIDAIGNINLAANTRILNDSRGGDLYISGANLNLANNARITSNRGSATIQVENDLIGLVGAKFIAAQDLNLVANKELKLFANTLQASAGSINLQSSTADAKLLQIDGGSFYASKDLNIYGAGDVSLNNLSFNLVNNTTRLKDINVHSGKNLTWNSNVKALPKISGKVQLEAAGTIDLQGKLVSAKDNIQLQADHLQIGTELVSEKGIDLVSKADDLELYQALTAQNDINVNSLAGGLSTNNLRAISKSGKIALLAHKDVNISSGQTSTAMPSASLDGLTTSKSSLAADQGIIIGSVGEGKVTVKATDLNAENGTIQLSGQNDIAVDGNTDVKVNGDEGQHVPVNSIINAKSILIKNKKGNINIKDTQLNSTADQLYINSEMGKATIEHTQLKSKGNTEIFAKDILTLKNVTADSDQHLAVNTKRTLYLNADYTPATVWDPLAKTALTAKGILSLTAVGNQVMQNATLTGGAFLLETGNLYVKPGLIFNATGSELLKNDAQLNSLNGDLSIQASGGNGLIIDPKIMNLSATGDIELTAKKGVLKLAGYGGTQGNGSEQIVKLNTASGEIKLQGNKIELQGSQLTAAKDLSIVSTGGDLIIDGVRNTITNQHTDQYKEKITEIDNERKALENSSTYEALITFVLKEIIKVLGKVNSGELIEGSPEMEMEFHKIKKRAIKEYPEHISRSTELSEEKDFYSEMIKLFNVGYVNGQVHTGTKIISDKGNIQLVSNKGLSISGSTIDAKDGKAYLEAAGTLDGEGYNIQGKYNNLAENSVKKGIIKGSIIIDANQDSYEQGSPSGNDYRWFSPVSATTINGSKGVSIKATGKQATDNLILQGVSITSDNDVNIEAYKNIIFDTAINNSFNKSQKTETKRKWYGKKKIILTTETAENSGGLSVDINAKNINIKSQEKNTTAMIGQNRTSIDMYSSQLTAIDGKINIEAGGDLNFLTADDVSLSTIDITKKSSFLGVKLNKSHTTNTRNVKSELPAVLNADYIGTKSGFDTRLKGTVFNYLDGANIQAGGNITLEGASKTVAETLKKESNSVVWQSMQDKGSITETAELPSFNGPLVPTFKAAGGLIVQVPVKDDIRSALDTLVNQQGTTYLKDLVLRNDVDWQAVKLAQQQWDYKSQGLTPAAAAIIVIIITVATYGYGAQGAGAALFQTSSATSSAMANAAVASMASQAAISLANNGGDPLKALKSLGSSEYIKSLAVSVLSAGALSAVGGTAMMQNLEKLKQSGDLVQKIVGNTAQALVNSTIGAGINTAVSGNSLSENLENYLASGVMTALQGTMAQYIKPLESQGFSIEYVLHKIAHAAAGCGAAAATKQSCEAGAIGAGVSEVAAEYLRNPKVFESVDDALAYKNQIVEVSKGIAGAVAVVTGYDSTTAMASADNALKNNFVFLAAVPTAGEALVGLTLGAIRTCATNAACVSRAAQLGISVSATLAANSNSTDDKKVVKPISVSSGGGTATPPPEDEDKIKEILEKTSPGRATKGRTTQYEKQGDYSTAQKDFNSLQPKDIRTISGPNNQTGWVGKLNDGRIVNVRNWSSNNEITLEIQSGSKVIKIRYSK